MTEVDPTSKPAKQEQTKGHCPNCGPGRFADVVGHHRVDDADPKSPVWSQSDYRMLQCGGCKTVYFQEVFIFSEDYDYDYDPITNEPTIEYNEKITYWPAPAQRKRPDWLDDLQIHDSPIHKLLTETYNTLDVDARVLAAGGARTILDTASERLQIDPAVSFDEKLIELEKLGAIGRTEKEHLSILTNAGGAALHRGWEPSLDQLATVMSVLEPFIHRTFLLDRQLERLRTEIPERQKRQKKQP